MVNNINIKARIKRHSRIFKDNILNKPYNTLHKGHGYNIVILFMLFIIPIYPTFASFVYTSSPYDFYRGDIDESSIMSSYNYSEEQNKDTSILESKDGFITVNTLQDDNTRDLSGTNEIVTYDVKSGESIGSISNKFGVSVNSIYWANNFSKEHIIHPGDKIKVPPVSGLLHQVKAGETIQDIAKKYGVEINSIIKQNLLDTNNNLLAGNVLVIPGAIKKIDVKVDHNIEAVKLSKLLTNNNSKKTVNKKTNTNTKKGSKNYEKSEDGSYSLTRRAPKWKFYWGNCTRYVGQYKNVNWSGNAKDWLRNAKNKGHKTSSTASVGSIVVFNGRGYNPIYGHVGIVTGISGGNIIVSDMNYRRLGEVTSRKVSKNDGSIKGYIIVD